MLSMYILAGLGAGLVIYAIFGVFTPGKPNLSQKQKAHGPPLLAEDSVKEQKIQRLQSQLAKLQSQLEQSQASWAEEKSGLIAVKEKEAEFSLELKRREEWVAKAEAELAKIKAENLDLNKKFIIKGNEMQEEFTKNVNLARQMREIKAELEAKEMSCRLKEDQLQAQKHQAESQLKNIADQAAAIVEFNRKEKISEWVPKLEFNQLNAEYAKLEKDLRASQERLKSFAVEIAHLRQLVDKKAFPAEAEVIPEEIKPPETAPREVKQEEKKLEEIKVAEESKAPEEIKAAEENIEK